MSRAFPELPILPANETRRSSRDKYGGMYPLALGGLAFLAAILTWFAWNVWSLSHIWSTVYVLSDPRRPDADRMTAANHLASDPEATPRQLWDLALNRNIPVPARYTLALALDERALEPDASAYALAIARSEGWPDWLRLALVRPLAYGAATHALPKAPLEELRQHESRAIQAWAAYAQAVGRRDSEAGAFLESLAEEPGGVGPMAQALDAARKAESNPVERRRELDRATERCNELPETEPARWPPPSARTAPNAAPAPPR